VEICPVGALTFGPAEEVTAAARTLGTPVYGEKEAGGTSVLNSLTGSLSDHGLPLVPTERYPEHHIPLRIKVLGLVTLTGGLAGKRRAVVNALRKPWRLKFRYWHRPEG
jgi:hypothetical protein